MVLTNVVMWQVTPNNANCFNINGYVLGTTMLYLIMILKVFENTLFTSMSVTSWYQSSSLRELKAYEIGFGLKLWEEWGENCALVIVKTSRRTGLGRVRV